MSDADRSDGLSRKKEENVRHFRQRLPDLLDDPLLREKFVVIHDERVKGAFDTFGVALRFALANFPMFEVIVQQVVTLRPIVVPVVGLF